MNIATWLQRAGARHGGLPAVALGDSIVHDYRALARRSAGLASALRSEGNLEPGDRVAIAAKNHPAYVEALFSIWWAGMVAVPIDSRLHPSEIAWILQNAGAQALFLSPDLGPMVGALEWPSPTRIVTFGSPDYERLVASPPAEVASRAPQDGAWLFYTSGTTGRPKGALLSHRNLAVMGLAHVAEVDPTSAGDVLIHLAPMSHASGMLTIPHVCCLGLNVIPEAASFTPGEAIELIHRWRRASLFAAPTMIRRLVDLSVEIDQTAIRSIVWGGAPMLVSDTMRALECFGPCLAQVYGQGETPMTITALAKEAVADRNDPAWLDRLASAGTPRAVVEVFVADAEDSPQPPGEPGEVLVRGDTVMSGYWENPEATAAALRGGWLHTGDIGVMDEHGNLTLKDRSKDLIISGGMNIYPREVEEVLAAVEGVHEVSVIGRPDPEWGEVVVAYIAGAAPTAELDRTCLERIARFKRPRDYVYVDALPKSSNGKILKSTLRELDARQRAATDGS
jgi:long-chain acyl-CoA synthetase